jgi:hypothetical protein
MKPSQPVIRRLRHAKRLFQGVAAENAHFDGFSGANLAGWCEGSATGPMRVRLMFGDLVIAEVSADKPRPDVEASGRSDAECGFVFTPSSFEPALKKMIARGEDAPQAFRVVDAAGRRLPGPVASLTPSQALDAAALACATGLLKGSFDPGRFNGVR